MNIEYIHKYERGDTLVYSVNVLKVIGANAPVKKGALVRFDDILYTVERLRYCPWDSSRVDVYVKEVA